MIYHSHGSDPLGSAYATLDDLDLTVRDAVRTLRQHQHSFDGIVVTGISGLVVGAPVALTLKKPLCVVRKTTEDCHDGDTIVNSKRLAPRMLFLDDCVATGSTRGKVEKALYDFHQQAMESWVRHGQIYNDLQPVRSVVAHQYLYDRDVFS